MYAGARPVPNCHSAARFISLDEVVGFTVIPIERANESHQGNPLVAFAMRRNSEERTLFPTYLPTRDFVEERVSVLSQRTQTRREKERERVTR